MTMNEEKCKECGLTKGVGYHANFGHPKHHPFTPSSEAERCPCGAGYDQEHVDKGPGYTHIVVPSPKVDTKEGPYKAHYEGPEGQTVTGPEWDAINRAPDFVASLNLAYAAGRKDLEGWIADRDRWINRYEAVKVEIESERAKWSALLEWLEPVTEHGKTRELTNMDVLNKLAELRSQKP